MDDRAKGFVRLSDDERELLDGTAHRPVFRQGQTVVIDGVKFKIVRIKETPPRMVLKPDGWNP